MSTLTISKISGSSKQVLATTLVVVLSVFQANIVASAQTATSTAPTTIVNTGTASGVLGNNNIQNAGIGINGNVTGSNLNQLSTGSNVNNVYVPTGGGSSAIILPRNPLGLNTPQTGQSVFGFQAGVQNNPYPTSIGTMGGQSALGWFAQGGVTIPFGKIPSVLHNNQSNVLDDARQLGLDQDRNVFAQLTPQPQQQNNPAQTNVNGRIIGMNAYSYSTTPTGKINMPGSIELGGKETPYQPKLLALAPGDVFTRPLNTGEKAGVVEIGKEYPYLGHIRAQGKQAAWIKILMPDGTEGWVSSRFEFVKTDYTEVDDLAVASPSKDSKTAHTKPVGYKPIALEHVNKRHISLSR